MLGDNRAFPAPTSLTPDESLGLSKREFIASHFAAAIAPTFNRHESGYSQRVAIDAVKLADSLIEELKKERSQNGHEPIAESW